MVNAKIKSYVGFAIKSNQVVFGVDNLEVFRKKLHLIIVSADIAEKSMNKLKVVSQNKNAEILVFSEGLEDLTSRKNCKAIGITNFELAKAIKNSSRGVC